jgi:uncharacterized membrane protein YvlD (DUF360 family)
MNIVLVGCLMLFVVLPLLYTASAWVLLTAVNFLYPLPFLETWGFWHYLAAGFILSFISSVFKTTVVKD